MLFCGGEAEPWRETIEGFLDAVGGCDVAGAAEYCAGDFSDLLLYLKVGQRPEPVVGLAESEEGWRLEVWTPGVPGLTVVIVERDGDWLIYTDRSLEMSRAAALNATFGAE